MNLHTYMYVRPKSTRLQMPRNLVSASALSHSTEVSGPRCSWANFFFFVTWSFYMAITFLVPKFVELQFHCSVNHSRKIGKMCHVTNSPPSVCRLYTEFISSFWKLVLSYTPFDDKEQYWYWYYVVLYKEKKGSIDSEAERFFGSEHTT